LIFNGESIISLITAVWVTGIWSAVFNIRRSSHIANAKITLFGMNLKKNKEDFYQLFK
jgi:hypothetical protein